MEVDGVETLLISSSAKDDDVCVSTAFKCRLAPEKPTATKGGNHDILSSGRQYYVWVG